MTAGLVDPTVTFPAGTRVSVRLVNADTTSAQRLVFAAAGAHTATLAFTASRAGSYRYLCPVPGHAQAGMAGEFVVSG